QWTQTRGSNSRRAASNAAPGNCSCRYSMPASGSESTTSKPMTDQPAREKCRATCRPRKPAAPVTTTLPFILEVTEFLSARGPRTLDGRVTCLQIREIVRRARQKTVAVRGILVHLDPRLPLDVEAFDDASRRPDQQAEGWTIASDQSPGADHRTKAD